MIEEVIKLLTGSLSWSALMFGIKLYKNKKDDKEFLEEEGGNLDSLKHINQVEKLRKLKEPPETIIEIIDVITQDFLKKKFHLKGALEYSDLINFFREKEKPQIMDFCRRMNEALYSGEVLTQSNIADLITDLESIMMKEDPKYKDYHQHKDAFYSLVDKIKIFDSQKQQKEKKEEYISQKTKEIILSKLSGKKSNLKKSGKIEIPNQDQIKTNFSIGQEDSDALSLLNPQESLEAEPEEDKLIESIDDLDRIKQKIQDRKKSKEENLPAN